MRDTSRDERTYWLRNGLYYGRARSLGEDTANCNLPVDKLNQMSESDRALLLEEVKGNPSFCSIVARCMNERSDWYQQLSASAREAIANEFNSSTFPGRKGQWNKLRAKANDLLEMAATQIRQATSKLTPEERLEIVRGIARGRGGAVPVKPAMGDLGFLDILSSLVGTISQVGANVYNTKVIADTKEDIARIQANSAVTSLSAQQSIAAANAAIAAAQAQQAAIQSPVGAAISSLTTSTVGGIPVMLIVIPLVGTLFYLFTKRR